MSENYSLKELNEWADKVIDCISKWADEMNKAFNGTPTSIKIEKLDFSEHDKVFEDKIAELENIINNKLGNWDKHGITYQEILDMKAENDLLKQRIVELESKEMEIVSSIDTSNPLSCAESLIEHMTHCEKFMIMPERDVQTFSVEELKEIADYLMVYYKHHKDRDAEDTISF